MRSLLPCSCSDFEFALESLQGRIEGLDVPIKRMMRAAECPVRLLPWLAHSVGVERWPDSYTEEQKREAIASSISVYKVRGTLGAVKRVLDVEGFRVDVVENVVGPFTLALNLSTEPGVDRASREAIESACAAVMSVKNERTQFVKVAVNNDVSSGFYVGATVSVQRCVRVVFDTWQESVGVAKVFAGCSTVSEF